MHSRIQRAKLNRGNKLPPQESNFLNIYSLWQETKDETLRHRLFMSLERLLKTNPGFDFRQKLWQAV